jgi:hypothetical protein
MKPTIPIRLDATYPRTPGGENPFYADAVSGERDYSAINALIRDDTQKARRLCVEAGEDWVSWSGEAIQPSRPRTVVVDDGRREAFATYCHVRNETRRQRRRAKHG